MSKPKNQKGGIFCTPFSLGSSPYYVTAFSSTQFSEIIIIETNLLMVRIIDQKVYLDYRGEFYLKFATTPLKGERTLLNSK